VGDDVYGRSRTVLPGRGGSGKPVVVDRFFLHAFHLGFEHPVTREPMAFTVPDPPAFAAFRAAVLQACG
jgi:23S rRNA-/tRNA-specific pseudouridylate synthase